MSFTLDQLKTAFKKNESGGSRPNNYYPFWKMNEGEQAVVRFLPDKNEDNPMGFVVEKLMHTLTINGERKSIPCLKMYDEDCPICKVSSAYYKEEDKANGKKYWRKKQNLVQALIIEDPLPADQDTGETHEGKVRFLALGFQLFNIIKEAFESGELDEIPFAFEGGCDFIIKKTKQGEYATYAVGSKFARKSSDLTEEQIALVTDNMVELQSLIPAKPELETVEGMLEAALTGGEYNAGGDGDSSGGLNFKSSKDVAAESSDDADATPAAVTEETSDEEFDDEADKILQQIRSRKSS
jgi:hypothetical protein